MAKVEKAEQLKSSYKNRSYKVSPCSHKVKKKTATSKKDWDDARCSICMECPHNAVLLLCSSYSKGCRPYMCATSPRFSNCLDQYQKAYTKLTSLFNEQEVPQLCCPICRGQVKGWAVVEQARKDLNKKKRSCMAEKCMFVGNYKQLKKHVKAEHPLSRPREVDPALEEKWKTLEGERERSDVISAITSADPGAIVLGDFVIEGGPLYRNNFGGMGADRLEFVAERQLSSSNDDDDDDDGLHRALGGGFYADFLPTSRPLRRYQFGRLSRRLRWNRGCSG